MDSEESNSKEVEVEKKEAKPKKKRVQLISVSKVENEQFYALKFEVRSIIYSFLKEKSEPEEKKKTSKLNSVLDNWESKVRTSVRLGKESYGHTE